MIFFLFINQAILLLGQMHYVGNMERHALEGVTKMRVRLTGRYRVLRGTRYWNPYPTLTMDPNSHPDHKTNQTTEQTNNYPANQPNNQSTNQLITNQPTF